MIEPQRLGRFLQTDNDGYIQPDVSWRAIGNRWRPLVDYVAQTLMETGAVSAVYIRGSVPRGLALENISDADFIYIAEDDQTTVEKLIQAQAAEKFPFTPKVELSRLTAETLNRIVPPRKTPYFHMLLKTQSLFVAGRDVTRDIAPFKLGPEIVSHAFGLRQQYASLLSRLKSGPMQGEQTEIRRWFSRRLLRAGLEVTIDRKPLYTRDLYLCYEQFAAVYPDYKARMYSVLLNCLNGHEDIEGYEDLVAFIHYEGLRLLTSPAA